jgi:hypothetical protein
MNNLQLDAILFKDKISKKYYLGAFPIDILPTKFDYPSCFIINNQKSSKKGEHWIAVYFDTRKNCYFFDSFGLNPNFYSLENYLNYHAKTIYSNKKQLQSIFSEFCGYYCVIFLLLKARKYSFDFILSQFKDPESNENLLKKLTKNE